MKVRRLFPAKSLKMIIFFRCFEKILDFWGFILYNVNVCSAVIPLLR